jgi:23S rRNA (adenine2503-C2)-methyltransferase
MEPVTTEYISGKSVDDIVRDLGYTTRWRAQQIYSWVAKGVADFSGMTNLPNSERNKLQSIYGSLRSSAVHSEYSDDDGSIKLQIRLKDGAAVECVLLEDIEGRKTACLSSQVGCPMACSFCRTGQLGFLRNLGADEIMEQFHFLKDRRGIISNVVFMGMGEPLLNLEAVRKSITLLNDPLGINMSLRKITISTSGIVPGILDLAENGPRIRLAVSLTTADEAVRSELMPVNKHWNLTALKESLLVYQQKTGERITLETVLTGNKNSDQESAKTLAQWVKPLKAQINLIPWNVVPGLDFTEPTPQQIRSFTTVLERNGIVVVQRMKRGRGVMGACGQLGDTLRADSP